jgi:hypothetical protein
MKELLSNVADGQIELYKQVGLVVARYIQLLLNSNDTVNGGMGKDHSHLATNTS